MYLKCSIRRKDGKEHRSWSVVESRRVGRSVVQRHVLYLGELNDSQQLAWEKCLGVFDEATGKERQMALFPSDRTPPEGGGENVQVRLNQMRLERPRQWGACWMGDMLWRELGLDGFFRERLGRSREGTDWEKELRILALYRLLSPGSEWRLHRHWFGSTALEDLLGVDARAAQDDTLYRAHDRIMKSKEELFVHLRERWEGLFGVSYEVLLYDLTSTYFECEVPADPNDPRRFGYSRDKRGDCVQVVVALVVTPEGFPLAYEMMPGNTSDKTTLREMVERIKKRFGTAQRIWVMDRGIPTEEVLAELRAGEEPVFYLVGTPKARLNRYESALSELPWQQVRQQLRVKLLPTDGELYVLAESQNRACKDRGIRRRRLKSYWKRLSELRNQNISRDNLLKKIGAAQEKAGRIVDGLVEVTVTEEGELLYQLNREKLRTVKRNEGRYLLRTNMKADDPELIWRCYMQLCFVEEAFRTLKGDLAIRPIFHKNPLRIEAHLFIAFLSYCLSITLRQRLRSIAPGLMPRVVFEKLSSIQMLDVYLPTTDGRELLMARRTEPDSDVKLLLHQLNLELPPQPPPKIRYPTTYPNTSV
jgi:transposase